MGEEVTYGNCRIILVLTPIVFLLTACALIITIKRAGGAMQEEYYRASRLKGLLCSIFMLEDWPMRDLSYFNLGFRSDYIFSQLSNVREGSSPDENLLSEAVYIIDHFLSIGQADTAFSHLIADTNQDMSLLIPLLWEVYPDLEPDDIFDKLRNVVSVMSKANNLNEKADMASHGQLGEAISFFSKLADVCLSKSATDISRDTLTLQ